VLEAKHPSQEALLGSCVPGGLHSCVNVPAPKTPYTSLPPPPEGISFPLYQRYSHHQPMSPSPTHREGALKDSMEPATQETKRSPRGSRASPRQAAEPREWGARSQRRAEPAERIPSMGTGDRRRPVRWRSHSDANSRRCHTRSKPMRPDPSTRLSAPTLPDSSLGSRKARRPQASTLTTLTVVPDWHMTVCILSPAAGGSEGQAPHPPSPAPGTGRDPDPVACTRLHKARRPAGRDKAGWGAGTYLGAERCPDRRERGGQGLTGRRRARSPAATGGCGRRRVAWRPRGARRTAGGRCHGARAARGARGAGGGGARGGGARARAAGLRRRGRRTIASPCRRPPAPAGGPGPSGARGPVGLGAGPESPPPRPAPWQPRPLSVLPIALQPRVVDLPRGERSARSSAGS
jgi:hypothetical protein